MCNCNWSKQIQFKTSSNIFGPICNCKNFAVYQKTKTNPAKPGSAVCNNTSNSDSVVYKTIPAPSLMFTKQTSPDTVHSPYLFCTAITLFW